MKTRLYWVREGNLVEDAPGIADKLAASEGIYALMCRGEDLAPERNERGDFIAQSMKRIAAFYEKAFQLIDWWQWATVWCYVVGMIMGVVFGWMIWGEVNVWE